MISEDRALLVVLDLIAAERKTGRVALPVTTTRVAERVCKFHGLQVSWTPTSLRGLTEATAADDVIFGADGHGGVVGPGLTPDPRRHRGVRPAARPGRPHPADPQPDRRAYPQGTPAQTVHAHPLGGKGQRHAHGYGGRRGPHRGHHRRGQDRGAGRWLGARAA